MKKKKKKKNKKKKKKKKLKKIHINDYLILPNQKLDSIFF